MPVDRTIKLRGGTTTQWVAANPVLSPREVGIETDTNKFKFGDGLNAWNSLPYAVAAASGSSVVNWADILGKPVTFTPSAHTHEIADVNGLSTSLTTLQDNIDDKVDLTSNQLLTPNAVARMMGWADGTIEPRPRALITTTASATSGVMQLVAFTPAVDITVSSIAMATSSLAAGLTLSKMGLYQITGSSSATLLARTANDTGLFTSPSTVFTRVFDTAGGYPANVTLTAGTRYAAACLLVGAAPGNKIGYVTPTSNFAAGITPEMSFSLSGQTDLPATTTSLSNTTAAPWARLS